MAVAIPGFNSLTHSQLRETSTRLAGTIRYLYNQAALKGLCMRMVFDLHKNTYHVEASVDGTCLVEALQTDAHEAKRKEEERVKKEEEARKTTTSTNTTIGGWSGEAPISLELKKTTFQQMNEGLLKGRQLPEGIRFDGVFVSHQKELYTKERGPKFSYLHCFPLGRCERAMIYIVDSRDKVFSLEVKPLTGRVIVHNGKIKLTDSFIDRKRGDDPQ
jgi:general secretion pathway protein H